MANNIVSVTRVFRHPNGFVRGSPCSVICPYCVQQVLLDKKKRQYRCCRYTISEKDWRVVERHVAVVSNHLRDAGVYWFRTDQDVVTTCIDAAKTYIGFYPFCHRAAHYAKNLGFRLAIRMLVPPEDARRRLQDNGLSTIAYHLDPKGVSVERSLAMLTLSTQSAIRKFKQYEPDATTMDWRYLLDWQYPVTLARFREKARAKRQKT